MRYKLSSGKVINIPDDELKKSMEKLEISYTEAVELWLVDNDYEVDIEQEELEEKAKAVRVQHDANNDKPRKKPNKPRTVKTSDAKKELFASLSAFLSDFSEKNNANCEILTENKLFQVEFGGEVFKIDIIQHRRPKN